MKPLGLCLLLTTSAHTVPEQSPAAWKGANEPVAPAVAARMHRNSFREGCPTPISDLAHLYLVHWGFDGKAHPGEIIVHRDLAEEVLGIFRELFDLRFPIEKMRLVDEYGGDDDASMTDNNTSGFNCRFVPGKPETFSKHSHGRAIDINPRQNPMITAKAVLPPSGATYSDRKAARPGMVRDGDAVVRAFSRRGWVWGGTWINLKDYQHFEK